MFRMIIMMLVVLISSQSTAQKIYKWVDEDGQIHYSSTKPSNQTAETMRIKEPKTPEPKEAEKAQVESDTKSSEETSEDENKSEEDAEAEEAAKQQLAEADRINNRKQCELAKSNMAALNASVRINRTNDKGETVRMTDDERVNAMKTAQEGIKRYCK